MSGRFSDKEVIEEENVKRREFIKAGSIITAGVLTMPWWMDAARAEKLAEGSIQNMEELFSVTKADMKKLIATAMSHGAEFADLFFEYRISAALRMEEDIIKDVSRGIVMGLGVRAVQGDQVGYAYTDELNFDKMNAAALAASYIAGTTAGIKVINVSSAPKKDLYSLKELSVDADLNTKLGLIQRSNVAAKKYSPKITKAYIGINDEMKQIMYMNSDGRYFTDIQPMIIMRASTVAEDGTNRQSAGAAYGGRVGLEYFSIAENSPEAIAEEAAQIAVTNLQAKPAPAGPQVVVLGPGESGVLLHEAVGHGLEADFNRKSLSNYSNQIGQKVASEFCTIVDAGIYPNLRGSINVDDEGNVPTESVLIENGILNGYMHDSISAKVMKCAPTGNGRRQAYSYPPIPRMTNTYMRAGKYTPDEIIGSVQRGVYAKRFGGGQVDITKGDFTFGVYEAYLIENGKITTPLKDVTLIGNGPDVMRKVQMVGNDPTISKGGWMCGKDGQSVPVSVGIPTVKVSEITVGGTQS